MFNNENDKSKMVDYLVSMIIAFDNDVKISMDFGNNVKCEYAWFDNETIIRKVINNDIPDDNIVTIIYLNYDEVDKYFWIDMDCENITIQTINE